MPTRKARFKRRFLGIRPWKRHSLVLMVAGIAYLCVGVTYAVTTPHRERVVALVIALKWAPMHVWGSVFIFAGVLSIISSRWPPVAETWGYMVLTGLSAGWSATYGLGVIFAHSPASNLSGCLLWGIMAFLWWAISGLLNPDKEAVTTHAFESGRPS